MNRRSEAMVKVRWAFCAYLAAVSLAVGVASSDNHPSHSKPDTSVAQAATPKH